MIPVYSSRRSPDNNHCVDNSNADTCACSALARDVAAHFAEAQRVAIRAKFSVGDAIHRIRYSAVHDSEFVGRVARHLALDKSGILRIARVAEQIRPNEREGLLALIDSRGMPLNWCHLEELQRLRTPSARADFAQAVTREHLSIRELRSRIREMLDRRT